MHLRQCRRQARAIDFIPGRNIDAFADGRFFMGSVIVRVIASHGFAFSSATTAARYRCPSKMMVPLSVKGRDFAQGGGILVIADEIQSGPFQLM